MLIVYFKGFKLFQQIVFKLFSNIEEIFDLQAFQYFRWILFLFLLSKILTGIFLIIITLYLLIQKNIDENKKSFISKNKFSSYDNQIIKELSLNSEFLDTQDSLKFVGYNETSKIGYYDISRDLIIVYFVIIKNKV